MNPLSSPLNVNEVSLKLHFQSISSDQVLFPKRTQFVLYILFASVSKVSFETIFIYLKYETNN